MVELQALNYVLQKKDSSFFRNYNICDDEFQTYHKEYKYIKDFIDKYGVTPDITTFTETFKDFPVTDVVDSPEFLSDKLLLEGNSAISIKTIGRALQLFREGKQKEGIAEVQLAPSKLISSVKKKPVNITDDTSRYDHYVEKTNNLNAFFTKTGFEELDEYLNGGWDRNEDYVVVTARTNAGKSWWLTKFLNEAAIRDNITVGMYSGEMSEDKVGYRLDTLNSHISNTYLSRGREQAQKDYYNYQNKPINNKFYVCTPSSLGGVPTPQKLKAFVDKYHIQLLGIDQYSLLKDSNNTRSRNERFEAISMEIKLLQEQLKIPIIVVAQLNRSAAAKDAGDPGTDMIAGSDRIAQDATTVLSLKSGENGVIEIKVIKHRDGHVGDKLLYNWNADKGEFTYIPSEDDANKGAKCAEIHKSYNDEDEDCPF